MSNTNNNNSLDTLTAVSDRESIAALVDINDCAVNEVREYCRSKGYNPNALIVEETARIAGCDTMATYLRVSRVGSTMLLSRSARKSIWTAINSRRWLAEVL